MSGKNFTVFIVGNDKASNQTYEQALSHCKHTLRILRFTNPEEALFQLVNKIPDILIVNVESSKKDGLSLIELTRKMNVQCKIILTSESRSNAIEAIKYKVDNFILLPDSINELRQSVDTLCMSRKHSYKNKGIQSNRDTKIKVTASGGYLLLDVNKLAYCEADGSYTNLHFVNGHQEYSTYYLGKIEKILHVHQFARVSRSAVINLHLLKKIDRSKEMCTLEYSNQLIEIPISKSKLKTLKDEKII